jgi:hypothetical protein
MVGKTTTVQKQEKEERKEEEASCPLFLTDFALVTLQGLAELIQQKSLTQW